MNDQTFVDRNELSWKRLSELCDRGDSNVATLTDDELREFVRLYRLSSRDLTIARTRSNNAPLIDFLNELTGRAYGILYRAPRRPLIAALGDAITEAARTVRRRSAFVWIAALLFFGSGFFAAAMMSVFPQTIDHFVPPQMDEAFAQWRSGEHAEADSDSAIAMTGMYASNNPMVAIITGAVGAGTFGIGSIYFLISNGLMLGALAMDLAPRGLLFFLIGSIFPHGVPELTGVIFAGAAGLTLGWAIIKPGQRTRGDALRHVGKDALYLLATSVVCMFIAAPIEGFFSFSPWIPTEAKFTVGVIWLTVWICFWTFLGRTRSAPNVATSATPQPAP